MTNNPIPSLPEGPADGDLVPSKCQKCVGYQEAIWDRNEQIIFLQDEHDKFKATRRVATYTNSANWRRNDRGLLPAMRRVQRWPNDDLEGADSGKSK